MGVLARILRAWTWPSRPDTGRRPARIPRRCAAFVSRTPGYELQPEAKARTGNAAKHVTKNLSSVFAGTDLTDWLRANEIDTSPGRLHDQQCVLGSAADADVSGSRSVSDATGAIHVQRGRDGNARQVHETLMVLLHSNWAAVADTDAWAEAVSGGRELAKSDLVTTATKGRADHIGF